MVGEAHGHVQGESLKPCAAFLVSAFQLPDRQSEGVNHAIGKMQGMREGNIFSGKVVPTLWCKANKQGSLWFDRRGDYEESLLWSTSLILEKEHSTMDAMGCNIVRSDLREGANSAL
jgi:hypothetical protein